MFKQQQGLINFPYNADKLAESEFKYQKVTKHASRRTSKPEPQTRFVAISLVFCGQNLRHGFEQFDFSSCCSLYHRSFLPPIYFLLPPPLFCRLFSNCQQWLFQGNFYDYMNFCFAFDYRFELSISFIPLLILKFSFMFVIANKWNFCVRIWCAFMSSISGRHRDQRANDIFLDLIRLMDSTMEMLMMTILLIEQICHDQILI